MFEKLTNREKDVLFAICEKGLFSVKEIAKTLIIEKCTVRSHIVHIYQKTHVKCMQQLMFFYYKGLLNEYL